ncbi:unnamed protein product [Mycetohabitans rhizoxinica HKI 454]|uniref:Ribosomal protein S14 n=2 Tax=Mycetohabitans rhizoxinica TaxID=412963 RepID=E5ANH1_MYCRK|nr:unnamed protein product [Mycetohabitans rhizoxinica HKI 454]
MLGTIAMTAIAKHADPWQQTVRCLGARARESAADRPAVAVPPLQTTRRTRPAQRGKHTAVVPLGRQVAAGKPIIRIIDRPSSVTAIVYWSDAATCHYGYQGWRVATAEQDGQCALSGQPVRRGDLVYRPAQREPRPRNVDAMILASAMPQTVEAEAA